MNKETTEAVIKKIKADRPTLMTEERHAAFVLLGCEPHCHWCDTPLPVKQWFVLKHTGERDEMVCSPVCAKPKKLQRIPTGDDEDDWWCTPLSDKEYEEEEESRALERAREEHALRSNPWTTGHPDSPLRTIYPSKPRSAGKTTLVVSRGYSRKHVEEKGGPKS